MCPKTTRLPPCLPPVDRPRLTPCPKASVTAKSRPTENRSRKSAVKEHSPSANSAPNIRIRRQFAGISAVFDETHARNSLGLRSAPNYAKSWRFAPALPISDSFGDDDETKQL